MREEKKDMELNELASEKKTQRTKKKTKWREAKIPTLLSLKINQQRAQNAMKKQQQ